MAQALQTVKPERFGRYVLLDRIGEGGMAEVFRAVMPGAEGFKRTFVVKRILSHLSQSPRFVEMFIREANTIALLNHPNIVQVYDFGSVDGTYFLAMEYLRGRDLLALLRRLREMKRLMPVPLAAYVAHQVAKGLAYAHDLAGPDGRPLNIVHRDVSPSNVMCMRTGDVKLLDFGIAKTATEGMPENTDEGTLKGKLGYMPPERVRNEGFDRRADVYALGVVMWEMLTCRQLFRGPNIVETIKKVLEMPVFPPSSLRPEVSIALDAIVMRALDRDPAKRYPTAQMMADELEEAVRLAQYQTRMLPDMLIELFGSGLRSSQIALSCVTPELLAAAGASDDPIESGGTPTARLMRRIWNERWKYWRIWAVLAAAVIIIMSVLLRGRPEAEQAEAPAPTNLAPTAMPVPNPAPNPTPNPTPNPPAVAPTITSTVIPAKPIYPPSPKTRKGVVKKSKDSHTRKNPIADGLSIDPFAEAAARGRR